MLDSTRHGLEYANKACKSNNYPYVYWEGVQTRRSLVKSTKGWLVKKSTVYSFLNTRLNEAGFNKKEKEDFLSFWSAELKKTSHENYFIYFLQNKNVDTYLPMRVSPQPAHTNRIYMVAQPVSDNFIYPQPQTLTKIRRSKFTVVEWGGTVINKPLTD